MLDTVLEAAVKLDNFAKSPHELFSELDALDAIELAMLKDPERAVQEELDLRLWRHLVYPRIDRIRKTIASTSQVADKKHLSEQLDSMILSYLGRLDLILERLKTVEAANEARRTLCLHLTLYTGDLLRYRCSHNATFRSFDVFSSAQERYMNAFAIDPEDGTAFNQLAVIESLQDEAKKSRLKILFYYSRAAVSRRPFKTAKENIIRLSRKPESIDDPAMKLIRRLTDGRPADDNLFTNALSSVSKSGAAEAEEKFYFLASVAAISKAFYSSFQADFIDELLDADENLLKLLVGSDVIDKAVLEKQIEPLRPPLSQCNNSNESEAVESD